MASNLTLTDTDLVTALSYLNLGTVTPGKTTEKLIGVKNNTASTLENITSRFFPGLKNNFTLNTSGTPVVSTSVIKRTEAGTDQIVQVAKEDIDAELTARTARDYCFLYNGSTYTDYSTGNVSFMNGSTHKVYIGADELFRAIKFEFSTPGSYTGLAFKYWNGTAWTALPGDKTDGTSSLTSDGVLFLGTLTPSLWVKKTVYGVSAYWIEVSCTAVTTQAVADVLYWTYVYSLPYNCLWGTGTYYEKSDDATPTYTERTPIYEYASNGLVVYNSEPNTDTANHSMVGAFYYKTPQPGTYLLTFPTTSTCSVNGGSAVSITADGSTSNTNVIPGLSIVFSASLADTDTATVTVSNTAKYVWYATNSSGTPGTYQNSDLNIGSIAADAVTGIWIKLQPPAEEAVADNLQYFNIHFLGEDS